MVKLSDVVREWIKLKYIKKEIKSLTSEFSVEGDNIKCDLDVGLGGNTVDGKVCGNTTN